jgi:hypothetical protein
VRLSLILYLGATVQRSRNALAPALVGSVLWLSSKTLALEGQAAQFPMETGDFEKSSWLPRGAAWYLEWNPSAPEDSFLGTVALHLNTAHPAVQELARSHEADSGPAAIFRSIIHYDVARQLISGALASPEFLEAHESESFPGGSVGEYVRSLIGRLFPMTDFRSIASEQRTQPGLFEAELQMRLRFLSSVPAGGQQ